MQRIPRNYNTVEGWQPILHDALGNSVRVLGGKNYRWMLNYLVSGWGNDYVGDTIPHLDPDDNLARHIASMSIGVRSAIFTINGVYTMDYEGGAWNRRLSYSITPYAKANPAHHAEFDYPWSTAFVGDTYYYCHPAVGLISYNYPTDTFTYHGEDIGCNGCKVSGPYYAIAAASNRLIVLTRDTISWSNADEGLNHECSTVCGGNFISSSIVQYGQPIGIANLGQSAIVWTTNGSVLLTPFSPSRSQATEFAMQGFTATPIMRGAVPLNPYSFTHGSDGTVYILSKTGLRQISANETQIIEPGFINYLIEKELNRLALLHNQHAVRLCYSEETAELFISLIHHNPRYQARLTYSRAYVFSFKYEKWCSFDQPHMSVCQVNYGADKHLDMMLGFIGADARPHWFNLAFNNSLNGYKVPINSEVNLGPISLNQNDQIFNLESDINRVRLFVEERGYFFDPFQDIYDRQLDLSARFEAKLYTVSDSDCSSWKQFDRPYTLTKLLPQARNVNKAGQVQNYTCQGAGLYHIITIATADDSLNQFYAIQALGVELRTTNTL